MQIPFIQNSQKSLNDFAKRQRAKTIAYLQNHFSLPLEDCEDVFHDAFITLYENIQNGKLEELTSSLSTYLIAICKNKTQELLRKRGKYVTSSFEIDISDQSSYLDQQIEKILLLESDEQTVQEEKELLVRTIVKDLPSPCNELLWGFYRDGFSMATLAKMFNYASENAVKVTKYRCCEKFRKRYNESIKSISQNRHRHGR